MPERLSKDEYYLGIAKSVAERSPCVRIQYGAIIVVNDAIISTGYNGPAREVVNCFEIGCLKDEMNLPHGSGYDYCIGVHAEENAIINAARSGAEIFGGVMYLFGQDFKDKNIKVSKPCDRCKRAIINSGIKYVVIKKSGGEIEKIDVSNWIKDDSWNYMKRLQEAKSKKV
jgi:dCMP deaminase